MYIIIKNAKYSVHICCLFVIMLLCNSCSFVLGDSTMETLREDILKPMNLWRPRPPGLGSPPENASVIYKQGWEDGCDSGLAAYGSDHYKNLGYKFKQDYSMIHNDEYYNAWQHAQSYCRWFIWNYNRKGDTGWLF